MSNVLNHRIDFKVVFSVAGANPNGDPLMAIARDKRVMAMVKFQMLQSNASCAIAFKKWARKFLSSLRTVLMMGLRT